MPDDTKPDMELIRKACELRAESDQYFERFQSGFPIRSHMTDTEFNILKRYNDLAWEKKSESDDTMIAAFPQVKANDKKIREGILQEDNERKAGKPADRARDRQVIKMMEKLGDDLKSAFARYCKPPEIS